MPIILVLWLPIFSITTSKYWNTRPFLFLYCLAVRCVCWFSTYVDLFGILNFSSVFTYFSNTLVFASFCLLLSFSSIISSPPFYVSKLATFAQDPMSFLGLPTRKKYIFVIPFDKMTQRCVHSEFFTIVSTGTIASSSQFSSSYPCSSPVFISSSSILISSWPKFYCTSSEVTRSLSVCPLHC